MRDDLLHTRLQVTVQTVISIVAASVLAGGVALYQVYDLKTDPSARPDPYTGTEARDAQKAIHHRIDGLKSRYEDHVQSYQHKHQIIDQRLHDMYMEGVTIREMIKDLDEKSEERHVRAMAMMQTLHRAAITAIENLKSGSGKREQ